MRTLKSLLVLFIRTNIVYTLASFCSAKLSVIVTMRDLCAPVDQVKEWSQSHVKQQLGEGEGFGLCVIALPWPDGLEDPG